MAISDTLTRKEIEFLKFQKKKGVDAQTAFNKLAELRNTQNGGQPIGLGEQTQDGSILGRLKSAGEGFVGSLKSGGERISRGVNEEEGFLKKTAAIVGGAGDIVASPLAGVTGLIEPEIQKGVNFVIENAPDAVKSKVSDLYGSLSDEAKQTFGDLFAATGIFALPTKQIASKFGKKAITTAESQIAKKGLIGKAGEAFERSGLNTIAKRKETFIDDLVRPAPTKAVREDQVGRTTVEGFLDKKVTALSPAEEEMKKQLLSIDDLKEGMTNQQAFNTIAKANFQKAKDLEKAISENDFIFPKKELKAKLEFAKQELRESPTIVGDAERIAEKIIKKFEDLVDKGGAKGSSLLKSRKQLDIWIRNQKPKAFDAKTENAFDQALKTVRNTVNDFLDEKATNVAVKESLRSQRKLFEAMDNIRPKAAAEAENKIKRVADKVANVLGKKGQTVALLSSVGLVAGATALSQLGPLLAMGATGGGLYLGKKALMSPKLRIGFGKALKELDRLKKIVGKNTNKVGLSVAEINVLQQEIKEVLEED